MHKAMTTVELLAATALMAVLMLGVLGVVGSVGLDDAIHRRQASQAWQHAAVDMIQRDLSHAQRVWQTGNKVVMEGYGSLDRGVFRTQEQHDRVARRSAAHRPVRVEYRVVMGGDRSWLTRRQTHLDELTNRNTWSELVGCGVDAIRLEPDSVDLGLYPLGMSLPRRRHKNTENGPSADELDPVNLIGTGITGAVMGGVWLSQPSAVPDRLRLVLSVNTAERLNANESEVEHHIVLR